MAAETKIPAQFCEYAIARFYRGTQVIGAGFVVEGGYVLTCAHVVKQALGAQKAQSPVGQIIKINFPQISRRKKFDAEVLLYRFDEDDVDVAGLRVLEPLPEQIRPAKLVRYAVGTDFGVLGFPKGVPRGVWAYGKLEHEVCGWAQMKGNQQSYAIQPGFSGAPVWDIRNEVVVGMAVARVKAPENNIAFMVVARSLLSVEKELPILRLSAILMAAEDASSEGIQAAYRQCCPQDWYEPEPDELSAKLGFLLDMKCREGEPSAIDRFAAFLTLPELNDDPALRAEIQQWVNTRVDDFSALQQQVRRQLVDKVAERDSATESVLLIHVEPELSEKADHFVSSLYIADASQYDYKTSKGSDRVQAPAQPAFNERVTLESLEALILACLDEVVKKTPKELTIHLILPVDWLAEPFDHLHLPKPASLPKLPLPDVRIGARYRLTVRIAERLHPYLMDHYGELWHNRWRALQKLATGQCVCDAFTLADDVATQLALNGALNKAHSVGLKLTKKCESVSYEQIFSTLITTGTPAAVWLRCDQLADGMVAVDQINALLACKIALLEAVKRKRSDAVGVEEDAHIGHHLSFLWEDPALIPPPPQRLQMA